MNGNENVLKKSRTSNIISVLLAVCFVFSETGVVFDYLLRLIRHSDVIFSLSVLISFIGTVGFAGLIISNQKKHIWLFIVNITALISLILNIQLMLIMGVNLSEKFIPNNPAFSSLFLLIILILTIVEMVRYYKNPNVPNFNKFNFSDKYLNLTILSLLLFTNFTFNIFYIAASLICGVLVLINLFLKKFIKIKIGLCISNVLILTATSRLFKATDFLAVYGHILLCIIIVSVIQFIKYLKQGGYFE